MPILSAGVSQSKLGFQAATDAQAKKWPKAMTDLPPATVRVDIRWSSIEAVRGKYVWPPNLDFHINLMSQDHNRIIGTINWPPQWSLVQPGCSPINPLYYSEWTRFVKAVAARYGDRINTYEVLNEPDVEFSPESKGWGCWLDNSKPDLGGTNYGRFVALTAKTIRSVQPEATVLSGGLLLGCDITGQEGLCGGASLDFFRAALPEMQSDISGVGFHSYQFWKQSPPVDTFILDAKVASLRKITKLPLFMTEGALLCYNLGCTSPEYEAGQSVYVRLWTDSCRRLKLDACVYYSLTFNNWMYADLMNKDGTKRMGYHTLSERLSAAPTPPSPYPAPLPRSYPGPRGGG